VQETSEIGTDSVGEAQMSSKQENQLSDFTLRLLFVLFMALNMLNNMDHGVLPAGSIVIKDDLNLNNLQYGMIGSAVFGGLVLGKCFLFMTLCFRIYVCNSRLPNDEHQDGVVGSAFFRSAFLVHVLLRDQLLLPAV
jgi:hypothetical protein